MGLATDIVFEFIRKYPHKEYCSRARIQRLVYLADWWMLLHHKRRLLEIDWIFDMRRGPVNLSLIAGVEHAINLFAYTDEINPDTQRTRRVFRIINSEHTPVLSAEAMEAIEVVVEVTKEMPWQEFNAFVHSTFPLMNGQRGRILDLVRMAGLYAEHFTK